MYITYILTGCFILFLLGILLLSVSFMLGMYKKDFEKVSAYECGFNAFNDARSGYYINFYMIALLYILFDLEIILLLPYSFLSVPTSSSKLILIFIVLLLFLGFLYEYASGAIEWK